jgi:hypothetical protein
MLLGVLLFGATAASGRLICEDDAYDGETVSIETMSDGRVGGSETVRGVVSCCRLVAGVDHRTIAIVEPATGGCAVVYTKFGSNRIVATAKNDKRYCAQVYEKIKAHLETAGFESCTP